jgi:hypothetical protein
MESSDAVSAALGGEHADTTVSGATAPGGAVLPDTETGAPRQHGQVDPLAGVAPSEFPGSGEARDAGGVSEPDQIETERADIGTPVEGSEGE